LQSHCSPDKGFTPSGVLRVHEIDDDAAGNRGSSGGGPRFPAAGLALTSLVRTVRD